MKEFIEKAEKGKEEKFEIYLEKISKVNEKLYELFMKKKQEQQLSKQKTMRQLLQTETQIPNGLT